jgi:hypothetical protein
MFKGNKAELPHSVYARGKGVLIRGLPPPAPPLWEQLLGKILIRENLALCVILGKTVVREK